MAGFLDILRERAVSTGRSSARPGNDGPVLMLGAAALAGSLYAWAIFAAMFTYDGVIGPHHNAPGADWIVFHGAVRAFLDGNVALTADGARFTAFLNEQYGWWLSSPLPFHPWLYPPTFLLVVLPFGLLPFLASYAAFQAASFAALTAAAWGLAPRRPLLPLLLLASPAAAATVIAGQNAFLTAALALGGLRLLTIAPVWAGVLLGFLTIKPQFGLLIAVALLAGQRWRAIASATMTAGLLALAALLLFGAQSWTAWFDFFLHPDPQVHQEWMEWSRMWGLSVFTCARVAGLSEPVATALQFAALAAAVGLTWHCYRRPYAETTRILVVMAATMLAAPHVSVYDLTWLAGAACLFALGPGREGLRTLGAGRDGLRTGRDGLRAGGDGLRAGEMPLLPLLLLLFLWLAPLTNPPRAFPLGMFTPMLILGFVAVALTRDRQAGQPALSHR